MRESRCVSHRLSYEKDLYLVVIMVNHNQIKENMNKLR